MCNLSQEIEEKAFKDGLAEAIIRMYKKGYSMQQVSDMLDMDIDKVKEIIQEKE